jgi:hypothetical protein
LELALPPEYRPVEAKYQHIYTDQQEYDADELTTCGLRAVVNTEAMRRGVRKRDLPKESETALREGLAASLAKYYREQNMATLVDDNSVASSLPARPSMTR